MPLLPVSIRARPRSLRLASGFVLCLAVASGLSVSGQASVFGRDDRGAPAARTHARFEFVGLLHVPGASHPGGTATLVAPDRVLSAAHLFFDDAGEALSPAARYRFRIGSDFAREPYEEIAVSRIVALGGRQTRAPGSEHRDWIVLALERPVSSVSPAAVVERGEASLERGATRDIEMTAYHRDIGDGLRRVTTPCHALATPRGPESTHYDALTRSLLSQHSIVFHDCDSAGLSSGAGLFVRRAGRIDLAAVNIGKLGPALSPAPDFAGPSFNLAIAVDDVLRAAIVSR